MYSAICMESDFSIFDRKTFLELIVYSINWFFKNDWKLDGIYIYTGWILIKGKIEARKEETNNSYITGFYWWLWVTKPWLWFLFRFPSIPQIKENLYFVNVFSSSSWFVSIVHPMTHLSQCSVVPSCGERKGSVIHNC